MRFSFVMNKQNRCVLWMNLVATMSNVHELTQSRARVRTQMPQSTTNVYGLDVNMNTVENVPKKRWMCSPKNTTDIKMNRMPRPSTFLLSTIGWPSLSLVRKHLPVARFSTLVWLFILFWLCDAHIHNLRKDCAETHCTRSANAFCYYFAGCDAMCASESYHIAGICDALTLNHRIQYILALQLLAVAKVF